MSLYAEKTRVPVSQSRAEIEKLLERHKAKQYGTAVDYDLRMARVQFRLAERIVRFVIHLPDPEKVRGVKFEQQERQRWRALLLVIKAKLEAVENAIATFEQEFLGYVVMPNDRTMHELTKGLVASAYRDGKTPQLLLEAGGSTPSTSTTGPKRGSHE
jgi:hypothetical protein